MTPARQPPGLVELHAVLVHQEPHQLGDADRGVGVVELDRHRLRQVAQLVVLLHVPAEDVLQRGRGEEILLPQPQLLPRGRGVGRVEHPGQRIRPVALAQAADMVAGVEGVEPDRVDRQRRPQPQRVHPRAAPADHRGVVGGRDHPLRRLPDVARLVAVRLEVLDEAAEADLVGALAAVELPRIAVLKPGLGQLDLVAVDDFLAEQAVLVADAVAVGGHAHRRHALHEAGREPAEAAVAERRVGLELGDHVEIDVELLQRLAQRLGQAEVPDCVAHQPADQELEAEIIDPLRAAGVGLARRRHPAVDGAVAHDQDRRLQPVVGLGDLGILADPIDQPLHDFLRQGVGVGGARLWLEAVVRGFVHA